MMMIGSTLAYQTEIKGPVIEESRITGTLTLLDNTVYQVTDSMLRKDSLYLDEKIVPGQDLAIGGVIAAEMGVGLEIAGLSSDAVNGAVLDLDYGIKVPITNLLSNGDASDGTTGYISTSTLAVDAGQFKMTMLSTGATEAFIADQSLVLVANHEYLVRATVTTPRNETVKLRVQNTLGAAHSATANVPLEISEIIIPTALTGYEFYVFPNIGGTLQIGDDVLIDNLTLVDLTETYNAGETPTAAQMDTDFPDWFDGTIENAVWNNIPLGVFNVTESKRNGLYIDIVALDSLQKYDAVSSAYSSTVSQFFRTFSLVYDPRRCIVHAASAVTDYLEIKQNSLSLLVDYKYIDWKVSLTTNTIDTLAVSLTDATKTINIALAKTTASKNTAALIKTALDALYNAGGTEIEQNISRFDYVAHGNWDTASIATGETDIVNFIGGVATTKTTLETYPNYSTAISTNLAVLSGRDLLMWDAQLCSAFVRKNRDDMLEILPLHKSTADRTITKAERYKTQVSDATVKVTAVQMTVNGVVHVVGTTGLTMELRENPFMAQLTSAQVDTALTAILNDITLAEYKPFEMEFIGDPTLQPGDWILIEDAPTTGGDPTSLITHSTWHYRGRHILRGVGRTTATIKPVSQEYKATTALKTEIVTGGGSNADGHYLKLLDGTLICYAHVLSANNSTTGTAYDFPAEFIDTDIAISTGGVGIVSGGTSGAYIVESVVNSTSSYGIKILVVGAGTLSGAADNTPCDIIAVGRWKA